MKRINLFLKVAARFFSGFELPVFTEAVTVPDEGGCSGVPSHPKPSHSTRFWRGFGMVLGSGAVFFDWDKWDNWDTVDFIGFFCPTNTRLNWDNWDSRRRCRPLTCSRRVIWCLVPGFPPLLQRG
jgi:hypothetical protein